MGKHVIDWLVLGSYIAIIYLLVRPGSQGPAALTGYFSGLAQLATVATDFG